jgi:phospholipid/cholesterol/gamma-HCH transport system substrate-binding protein
MNERVMQFRIGMFVIVAGLVLTMMIIWFGESPALFRDHMYVRAHYTEAPGVNEGVPVRKSGIRIGEVTAVEFDERPDQPDGVIVTLALERRYKVRAGSVPRLSRSMIGDVAIDMLPSNEKELLVGGPDPATAPIIEGAVAPDPSKALAAATDAFEKVGGTLKTIDDAFTGLKKVAGKAERLDEFLNTWTTTGLRVRAAADGIDRVIKANENDVQPAVANLRKVSEKLNHTLDHETQASLKAGLNRFSEAANRLDKSLADAAPFFKDLGAPVSAKPATDFGQTVRRLNLIAADFNLLTATLRGPDGKLNSNGSLQKLLIKTEAYDNLNRMAQTAQEVFAGFKPVINYMRIFSEKIAHEPSTLMRGALQR